MDVVRLGGPDDLVAAHADEAALLGEAAIALRRVTRLFLTAFGTVARVERYQQARA